MAGASMNDIKARIKSVEGTMQITKAMELVATSKLRHAKAKAESAKPYMRVLSEAISDIAGGSSGVECPYTASSEGKTLYVVIAGDRGLAGGYNSNIFKLASGLDGTGDGIYLPIGKKATEHFKRKGRAIFSDAYPLTSEIGVGSCLSMAEAICEGFVRGDFTSVKLIYTRFVSMLTQTATYDSILPLKLTENKTVCEPVFEGDAEDILNKIVPQYIGGMIHAGVCEAVASECGARRSAMSSANKNADEMIGTLKLSYNRARQAVITQEITEIVSGAEAL